MTEEEARLAGWDGEELRRYLAGRKQAEAAIASIPVPPAIAPGPADSDPYHGITDTRELEQVIKQTRVRNLVRVAEVITPGSGQQDAFDREAHYRYQWMRTVGRPFSPQELRGVPVTGCAACGRLSGAPCDEHERKLGEPIPLPPHPWPSEAQGHYPGAIHMPPYRLENSVR